jgi:hypothetical protein
MREEIFRTPAGNTKAPCTGKAEQEDRTRARHIREHRKGAYAPHNEEARRPEPDSGCFAHALGEWKRTHFF